MTKQTQTPATAPASTAPATSTPATVAVVTRAPLAVRAFQTLADLEQLVAEGRASGPFAGNGEIEAGKSYLRLTRDGEYNWDKSPGSKGCPRPQDATPGTFKVDASGKIVYWRIKDENGVKAVVRRDSVTGEWIAVRTGDIQHTHTRAGNRKSKGGDAPATIAS
jgi:hypothetical protein